MQSSSIGKYRKDIQLLNKYFFIIFSHILSFKLALSIRCANFAASPLVALQQRQIFSTAVILTLSTSWFLTNTSESVQLLDKVLDNTLWIKYFLTFLSWNILDERFLIFARKKFKWLNILHFNLWYIPHG